MRRKGLRLGVALSMGLLSFAMPYIIIPVYFIVRPKLEFISKITQSGKSKQTKQQYYDPKDLVLCPRCGHDNPPDIKQCEECENSLGVHRK